MPKVRSYGFVHDKSQANAVLSKALGSQITDGSQDTFYVKFDEALEGVNALIDVQIADHIYSVVGQPEKTKTFFYWSLGTSKSKTQFDFVDKQPVSDSSVTWPKVQETAQSAKMTVSTFTGEFETYPEKTTQSNGADDSSFKSVSMPISTKTIIEKTIKTKEEEMADLKKGCDFDSMTAKAVHGKKIIAMVLDKNQSELLAISGQTGLNFQIEGETSDFQTKDAGGEWSIKLAGIKSWNASCDGLYIPEDEGRKQIVSAMEKGEYVCFGVYRQDVTDGGFEYTPIRKGLALVSSDELDAPSDDSATYSVSFDGTGKPWLIETASAEEIESMKVTVPTV